MSSSFPLKSSRCLDICLLGLLHSRALPLLSQMAVEKRSLQGKSQAAFTMRPSMKDDMSSSSLLNTPYTILLL